jgi:hypothetical protein
MMGEWRRDYWKKRGEKGVQMERAPVGDGVEWESSCGVGV